MGKQRRGIFYTAKERTITVFIVILIVLSVAFDLAAATNSIAFHGVSFAIFTESLIFILFICLGFIAEGRLVKFIYFASGILCFLLVGFELTNKGFWLVKE